MAAANTKTTSDAQVSDIAKKAAEQLVSTVKQGQQLTLAAAQMWTKALSAVPVPELPTVPGTPALPDVAAVTAYSFDLASDLLTAQREFTLQLADTLAAKSA
jgi:hypothetical protein